MAAKQKLTVKTEYGTFTRTTARAYKFLVISCGTDESYIRNYEARQLKSAVACFEEYSAAYELAQATGKKVRTAGNSVNDIRKYGRENIGKAFVAADDETGYDAIGAWTATEWKKYVDGERAIIAAASEKLEQRLAANRAIIENKTYTAHGWSSRYDLAVKAAEQVKTFGSINIKIISVETGAEAK
jgi:hypothetical protein